MTDQASSMDNFVPVVLCKHCQRPFVLGSQQYKPGAEPKRYPGAEAVGVFAKEEMLPFGCCGDWQTPKPEDVEYRPIRSVANWKPEVC